MAWIESHQELGGHPKTRKLAQLLGVHRMQVVGHLHALWWWALDYAEDGDLSHFDMSDIALAAEWDDDPELFVCALRDCGPGNKAGFLDGDRHLHDWDQYAGKLVDRRKRDRERKAEARANSRPNPEDVQRMSNGHDAEVDGTAYVPNTTQQNPTEPDPTEPADPEVAVLCEHLASRISAHRGNGKRPKINATWHRDMGLLLRRGELHVENATPWSAREARERIDAVFDRLSDRSNGFCWADQIQAPSGLREKWHKIEPALVVRVVRFDTPAVRYT